MIEKAIHTRGGQARDAQVADARLRMDDAAPLRYRIALLVMATSVAAATYAISVPRSAASTEPELVLLLSTMVLIKGGVATAVIAFVFWRLGRPIDPAVALGYLVGALPLTASIVWLWSLSQIPLGSLMFYTSLAGLVFVAHIDRTLFDALCLRFGHEGRVARLVALSGVARRARSGSSTGYSERD